MGSAQRDIIIGMKFVADSMLGRLAKWLRILGFDTLYSPARQDADIVRLARAERRLILTRDRAMAHRRGVRVFLLHSDEVEKQVREVMVGLGLSPANSLSRCPECNGELEPVKKAEVKDLVPPYVYKTQRNFHRCPNCGRIYWQGTHVARIIERLENLEESLLTKDRER